MRVRIIKLLILLLLVSNELSAEIELPSVLGSNMVLQQQSKVMLWGKARVRAEVKITTSWNNEVYLTKADKDGAWAIKVKTPVAGGPYTISIADDEEIILNNVLVGEVWFCSGQSNMEMPMRGFDRQPVLGANSHIAKAKRKTPVRIFTTDSKDGAWVRQYNKEVQTDCQGSWLENTSENVANTSAVAWFFANYLQEVLDVPVGIIVSSWGGSKVEAWMSREALSPFGEIDLTILDNDEKMSRIQHTPTVLYNAKIAPLINFTIRGFLWYQGESNRDNPELYARLMPAFVNDLRNKWDLGELPFYFVEIAPFNYEGAQGVSAARLREVQQQNMKDISNSGMVATLDLGNPVFIHPMDKETVGNRLAWWALAKTYGKTGFGYKPPTYKNMEIAGNKVYIDFENARHGLSPMWTALDGFEIAGKDKVFYPAMAQIETQTARLAVWCYQVAAPVAVRYAYKNYAEASIFSTYGIPVLPFRTDNWPEK